MNKREYEAFFVADSKMFLDAWFEKNEKERDGFRVLSIKIANGNQENHGKPRNPTKPFEV